MVDHRVVLCLGGISSCMILHMVLVPMMARRLATDVVEMHEMLLLFFKCLKRIERIRGHSVRARELVR